MSGNFSTGLYRGLDGLLLLGVCLVLTACGGGGGGGGSSATTARTPGVVVFSADKDTDGMTELYAALDDGSAVAKISGPLQADGNIVTFKVSPDGRKVAYSADGDTDGVIELYVVDVDGNNQMKVSQGVDGNGDVYHGNTPDAFWWSPDSTRLVYLADADTDEIQELYLANADGTGHHKINGSVGSPPSVRIGQAEWSPDSRYVAYYVRTLAPFYSGYAVDRIAINTHDTTVGGNNSVRVTGTPLANHDWVNDMEWSPDSTRIAYASYENTVDLREIYIAIAGQTTAQTRVSVPITGSEGALFRVYWSGDSRYLLYSVNGTGPNVGLYTHDTMNATPRNGARISGSLVSGGNIFNFAWSPDYTQIAYSGDQDTNDKTELYVALPGIMGSSVKYSQILQADGDVGEVTWSPDGQRIAYIADAVVDEYDEIFTVSAAGGSAPVEVTHDYSTGSRLADLGFAWSPDSRWLFYELRDDERGLFVTGATDSAAAHKVSGSVLPDDNVTTRFDMVDRSPWSADSDYLVFSAGESGGVARQIYSVEHDANDPQAISGALVSGGDVFGFEYR